MSTSTRTGRLVRSVLVVLALPALLLSGTAPVLAAGTGGIEITPVPGQRDGRAITTFRVEVPRAGSDDVPYLVSNVEDGPRSARVYAARVTRSDGNFVLDGPGSSPYVSMPDRDVMLLPGQVLEETFEVTAGPDGPPGQEAYAAVVVEVRNGAVVQRANTLIYLGAGPVVPVPILLAVGAGLLALVAGGGVVLGARRRRRPPGRERVLE